jgi:DNA-directed RNA polymerase specialized sigma24 family protein
LPETRPLASGYEQMLRLLSDDAKLADERYMLLRSKLVMYFEGRRLSPADDLADEVLHRVAKKIAAGEEVEDINRYVYGIARFVRLEAHRRPDGASLDDVAGDGMMRQMPVQLTVGPEVGRDDAADAMRVCVRKCLQKLDGDKRQLLLEYYSTGGSERTHIKQRESLAKRLGKSAGALQKQICLLRKKLSDCAHGCLRDQQKTW